MIATTQNSLSLVLAVVASGTMLALSAGPAEARSVEVPVTAFQLAHAEGRAALDTRLVAAARRSCAAGGVDRVRLDERMAEKACVRQAVTEARMQVAALTQRTQLASR